MKQLTLFVILLFSMSGQTTTLLHAGKLIDVAAGQVVAEQTVVIDKGRIVEVLDGYVNRDEAVVIDLRSATVMPGLMDMHVHLDGELNPPESYAEAYYMNSAEYALRATIYARRTLEAGFTTVRDLGTGDHEALFALRDSRTSSMAPTCRSP